MRFLLAFCVPLLAGGCQCGYAPVCSRVNRTPVIFVGTVLSAGPRGQGPFRFSIEEPFKGIKPETKEIEIHAGLCVAGYRYGKQYLILATRFDEDLPLISGDCTGSLPIEDAQDDLEFMRDWVAGKRSLFLQGRVGENMEDSSVRFLLDYEHRKPLSGVELIATKGGQQFRGLTDQQGRYRIVVSEPGRYTLVARFDGYASSRDRYDIKVERDSCSEIDIGMWTDSRISGSVYSIQGKPESNIPVQLLRASCKDCRPFGTAKTGADGTYEFRKVSPGEYLLGVNVTGLNSKVPYAPRFYPGVGSVDKAVPIRIEGAQILAQRDFTIEDRLPTRRIDVQVVWPDDRPVINASIECSSPVSTDRLFIQDWISRWVDKDGRASCEVLTDRPFTVEADHLAWQDSLRPVKPVATRQKFSTPPGHNDVTVRIVIDGVNDISAEERPITLPNDLERN